MISHYCLAYIWVCNGFYGKIYCSTILYSIGKYILVGLCVLYGKIVLGRYLYYGKYNGGDGGGADRSEAAKKPHRGCWEASSRLMISLFEADEKPHGRAHDHGEARIKPHRG